MSCWSVPLRVLIFKAWEKNYEILLWVAKVEALLQFWSVHWFVRIANVLTPVHWLICLLSNSLLIVLLVLILCLLILYNLLFVGRLVDI